MRCDAPRTDVLMALPPVNTNIPTTTYDSLKPSQCADIRIEYLPSPVTSLEVRAHL